MEALGWSAAITVAIFLLGFAFQLGRHANRIDALETWRLSFEGRIERIEDKIDRIIERLFGGKR
ncbi:MAG TPA: hypothetical protein VKQ05_01880 [Gemmatimonadales bacterium]|nr:hypothetical protein [Gemmatimonadales bacterium]